MLTLTDQYKESFCQVLLSFLNHYTKPSSILDNIMMELGGIIAKAENILKLHDDVMNFTKNLPVYWYHSLPGFDKSFRTLKLHLQKILKEDRFCLENLTSAVIAEMKSSTLLLQDEIIRLQMENQKLQRVISSESSHSQNNNSCMALITSQHAETIQVLDNKIHHLQEYLTKTLEENRKLKSQLNELIQKEKDLIAHNHHLISGNFLQIPPSRRNREEQHQQLACSVPRGYGERK